MTLVYKVFILFGFRLINFSQVLYLRREEVICRQTHQI